MSQSILRSPGEWKPQKKPNNMMLYILRYCHSIWFATCPYILMLASLCNLFLINHWWTMPKLHSRISLNQGIVSSNIHPKSIPDGLRKGQDGTTTVTMDNAHELLVEILGLRLQSLCRIFCETVFSFKFMLKKYFIKLFYSCSLPNHSPQRVQGT